MEPISNADRLVLLLRQKLEERSKTLAKNARGAAKTDRSVPEPSGLRALAAVEGVEDKPLRRAFIQNLLADQLGSAFLNDAQFQQVVTRVTDSIDDDPVTAKLLSRLIADLRTA